MQAPGLLSKSTKQGPVPGLLDASFGPLRSPEGFLQPHAHMGTAICLLLAMAAKSSPPVLVIHHCIGTNSHKANILASQLSP